VTGIWQTVWLESVPAQYVSALKIEPDLDNQRVRVTVATSGGRTGVETPYRIVVRESGREVARAGGLTSAPSVQPRSRCRLFTSGRRPIRSSTPCMSR